MPASQLAGLGGGAEFIRLTLGSHLTPWNVGGLGTGKKGVGPKGEAADLKREVSKVPLEVVSTQLPHSMVLSFLL